MDARRAHVATVLPMLYSTTTESKETRVEILRRDLGKKKQAKMTIKISSRFDSKQRNTRHELRRLKSRKFPA